MKKMFFLLMAVCVYSAYCSGQSKYEGDSVFRLISLPLQSETVQQFMQHSFPGESPKQSGAYQVYGEKGISLRFTKDTLESIFLRWKYYYVEVQPARKPPFNIPWGAARMDILHHLGPPAFVSDDPGGFLYYRYAPDIDVFFFFESADKPVLDIIHIAKAGNKPAGDQALLRGKNFGVFKQTAVYDTSEPGNKIVTQPAVATTDICAVLKSLLADASSNFSNQKKIKEISPTRWQMENRVPGAIITDMIDVKNYDNSRSFYYNVRIKDNIVQGPEANKAMDEWKKKISDCLPGYAVRETGLNVFSENPDDVSGYVWEKKGTKGVVQLKREVNSSNRASIFVIISEK